jgi:hypothetical protein
MADGEFADVVREGAIEKFLSAGAVDEDFAHVGDVKNAGGITDGEMFVGDAGVLDGHFPTAEFNELAAEFLVRREKRSAFQHWGIKKEKGKIKKRKWIGNLCGQQTWSARKSNL